MKKFEYKTITIPKTGFMKYKHDLEALDLLLNEHGKQGWEIAQAVNNINVSNSYIGNVIILKREINR